jgi:type IV pilus assembly protein PilN
MIRINLLAVERKPKTVAVPLADKTAILCILLLVATAAGLGWRFWSLRQESARLDADIAAAQVETERLRSVMEEVAAFEQRRQQLQQRVALIEELRRGQSGPVHLLDELSRALPDRLWLTLMRQENADLRVEGRTTSLTALSDFVGNLESSGYIVRPVEIVNSQVEAMRGVPGSDAAEVVTFSVRAQFALPGVEPATPAVTPAATTAPRLPGGQP